MWSNLLVWMGLITFVSLVVMFTCAVIAQNVYKLGVQLMQVWCENKKQLLVFEKVVELHYNANSEEAKRMFEEVKKGLVQ